MLKFKLLFGLIDRTVNLLDEYEDIAYTEMITRRSDPRRIQNEMEIYKTASKASQELSTLIPVKELPEQTSLL